MKSDASQPPGATSVRLLKGTGEGHLPPMLEQYVQLREQYSEYLLLFQVGDFYETFGEDAERASRLLGVALTHRTSKDFSTPMAGIPLRAADQHIDRLLAMGIRVAVADQCEDTGGGLVERKVTQVFSPGTLVEERLLKPDENYLAAVATGDGYALALLDLSTGEFRAVHIASRSALYEELAKQHPAEVLLAPEISQNDRIMSEFRSRFSLMLSSTSFEVDACERELRTQFGALPEILNTPALVRACGAVLGYARFSLQGDLQMVTRLNRYELGHHLNLSESAMTALEIFKPLSTHGTTLLDVLDQTRTSGGRRRLRSWLRQPLLDSQAIEARQRAVECLVARADLREAMRSSLYRVHDLERLSARVASGRALPREISSLARTLEMLPELGSALEGTDGLLTGLRARLTPLPEVLTLIRTSLVDDPPQRLLEGGLIREGFHAELDALRQEARSGREWMAQLEALERQRTGISSLKVSYNNILGYFIEVTFAKATDQIPADYRQIATLKDRARYTRPDIREKERQITRAETAAVQLESQVFAELRDGLSQYADHFSSIAVALSELDVLACFAELAAGQGWVRPQTQPVQERKVVLTQARHPVVEHALRDRFVPNDVTMDSSRDLLIITGPNMSGKSTYLRMVALCALLHQVGSFVPADEARLPIFDALHTRIGASDDLAGGRSTFMVEMSELAYILHQATPNSLIILDEIGRGTSTLDGLAIAQATLEELHELGSYTLFATHYFELTRLSSQKSGMVNLHVAALEEEDALTFYHQVMEGSASQSYGVGVAKLAGLPTQVVSRAQAILVGLQSQGDERSQKLVQTVAELDISKLSPLKALEFLYELQAQLGLGV